jgi:hypothetical protein
MVKVRFDGAEAEHSEGWLYYRVGCLQLDARPSVTLSEIFELMWRLVPMHIGLVKVIQLFDFLDQTIFPKKNSNAG